MAHSTRTDALSRPAVAVPPSARILPAVAILLGLIAAAGTASAQSPPSGPPGIPSPDSTLLSAALAPAPTPGASGSSQVRTEGAQEATPAATFTLRRIANPRYRVLGPPGALIPRALRTLIGTEYARAQVTRRDAGSALSSTDWEVTAGRESGERRRFEVWASGYASTQYDQLRMLRLSALQGPTEWSLGDVAPQPAGTLPWIQRLRGGMLARALPHGSDWRVLGGVVPTLTHGVTPNAGLGAILFDNLPLADRTSLSLGLMGFGRGAPQPGVVTGAGSDSLSGGGGAALYAARVPSPYGDVSSTFMVQVHDLDGPLALAGLQALDWTLSRPAFLASVRDQVGTRNARQPGTERLTQAPSHEGRMNAQLRMFQGRAEVHLAGLTSAGTDASLAAETAQIGFSGALGGSGWYSGLDFSWNRRAPLFVDERRLSFQTGRATGRTSTLMRLERATDTGGRDQLQFTGEASTALGSGFRAALEPRLDWQARRLERGLCSARLTWPLFTASTRMSATVTLASARAQAFRGEVSEASLSLSFAPRARDRATMVVRRYEDSGLRSLEYSGSYDLQASLYSPVASLVSPRTGTLTVTVARADSASGVPDVLVSLDGKEFRFTDGEGVARFVDTPPGSHVVSIVERSLPVNQRVVGAATAFVTIERGRTPEPVRFEIARPVRRVRF